MRVLIALHRETGEAVGVTVSLGGEVYAGVVHPSLPPAVAEMQAVFLRGIWTGTRGHASRDDAERGSQERALVRLGHALRAFCLPGDSGQALMTMVDDAVATTVEVCFEAEDPALLGLPFEALCLPDGRMLVLQRNVVMFRRPTGMRENDRQTLAGPVKVLVAVGAPDEGTRSVLLDQESELQNILDGVTEAQRHENFDVRILEVGSPAQIADAIGRDHYHVLHISCHGRPGQLELEDEDGWAVLTTADELLSPVRATRRPLPMVLLNACHGGVPEGQTASLAEGLLRAGVPAVLAMQTWVSDFYAIEFARAFYHHLSSRQRPLASRALASARREVERRRQDAIGRGAPLDETLPEFATASLYVSGEERPLADFGREREPLRARPAPAVPGPVPLLGIDDLIGRREEQRETLRTLRDWSREYAGVVLTGIGGAGKSAVAGRVTQRLAEAGWLPSVHAGHFDLAGIAARLGRQLIGAERREAVELGQLLAAGDAEEDTRLRLVARALAEEPVLLVLDDFEQNLEAGGGEFLDPAVAAVVRRLTESADRGRLLLTCRYPLPGMDDQLRRVSVGPLSPAETQRLLLRLDALRGRDLRDLATVDRMIGGHPRMLEFLDALLRGGQGRLRHVTDKLRDVMETAKLGAAGAVVSLEEGLAAALTLGARDVLLAELLEIARSEHIGEALLQTAVSNLPVEPAGLARMLADEGEGDPMDAARALERLEDLSLVHRFPGGAAWVHRWTAEGLAGSMERDEHRARHFRAGRYRWWTIDVGGGLNDAVESLRNFLAGEYFDDAVVVAHACFDAFHRLRQRLPIAALASEVLRTLPLTHPDFARVADEEARAYRSLGFSTRALTRYQNLLAHQEALVQAEPGGQNILRELAVTYDRVGDLYGDLGHGELVHRYYSRGLAISERLAQEEPDRADYQRDLSVAYYKVGGLHRDLGQVDESLQAFLASLRISERLVREEPDHTGYRLDLAASYDKAGELYRVLGQGDEARQALLASLQLREHLALAEPDRAEFQSSLAVSYERVGDLYRDLGQGEQARQYYTQDLAIAERMAEAEPDRADYQRDLGIAYSRMGDLLRELGRGEQARQCYLQDLAITERLAQAEPERADIRHELARTYQRIGNLYYDLGQEEQARQAFLSSLQISEQLVQAEPTRTDYQRDLAVALERVGTFYRVLGDLDPARQALLASLHVRERLAAGEPGRADYQRDVSVSYETLGDLSLHVGQDEQAREYFARNLAIAKRLAEAEPGRADYQRDLSVAYERTGGLHRHLGEGEQAHRALLASLRIRKRLARKAPGRADYQRDLAVAYADVGQLYRGLGRADQSHRALLSSLRISESLVQSEPDRVDYQHDLVTWHQRLGDLYGDLGQEEEARQALASSLQLIEHIAQANPSRTDYQRDLAVALFRVGTTSADATEGLAKLRQAHSILRAIQDRHQNVPSDAMLIAFLDGLLGGTV